MRSRSAFILFAGVMAFAILIIPFVQPDLVEPADNGVERGAYIVMLIIFSGLGFVGWMFGYYQRGAGPVGLVRYVLGNLLLGGVLWVVLLLAWAGAEMADELVCLLGIAPFIWLGAVLARWNTVKGDVPEMVVLPKGKHGKREQYGFEQGMMLHGYGSEVSLPVDLASGTYRLGYRFPNASMVEGCEVVLSNVDNPTMDKRSIAVPESATGAIVFAAPETAHYVFEVDAVNSVGESLEWELTIERL